MRFCVYVVILQRFDNALRHGELEKGDRWYEVRHADSFPIGSEDPVGGKGRGFGKFVSLYSKHMDKVSSKLYHGARHEILNEIGKEEVYSDILSFLEGVVDE